MPTTDLARSILTFAALLAPLAAQVSERSIKPPSDLKAPPGDRAQGFDAIDPELCKEWLTYIASDELRGRATGTPGYRKAAEFVAARFAEFGLKPVGDDGTYFQNVPFFEVNANAAASYLAVTADGKELFRIKPGDGFGGRISAASDDELDVVYLEAKSADDVGGVDVSGKAVLLVDESPRGGRRGTVASAALRRAGPAAVVAVDDAAATRISSGSGRGRSNTYAVSSDAAARILAAIEKHGGGVKLEPHVEVERRSLFAANVVGLLEGSDPKLKHEIVGIGSHLDHIGARGDVINNGADDDGSGTTGVLAIARAFDLNPVRPRRSILFMCFSGEERGLVGSSYYANNPIFPNGNMVCELQMDMIGRNEEFVDRRTGEVTEKAEDNLNTLHLVGTEKMSMELHRTCLAMNEAYVGFEFEYDEEDVFYRSDHASFARKDIPIAFFFTGFHPQYHQPEDTVEKIDFPKLARVAKLVYSIAFEVANADVRPKRDRMWADIPQPQRRRGRGR